MALQPQVVSINLAGGLETKTEKKQVEPPNTLMADNVEYMENRNLKKRNGAAALPISGLAGTTQAMLGMDDQILSFNSYGGLYTYRSGTQTNLQSTLNVPYDNSLQPAMAIALGQETTGENSSYPTTASQKPAAIRFADIGNQRLIAVEGRHSVAFNINTVMFNDKGANLRLFIVDIPTGKVLFKGVHSVTNCREVSVAAFNGDWYISYFKPDQSEVVQLPGPNAIILGNRFNTTVCTGGSVAATQSSSDLQGYSDLKVIGNRLYHAVSTLATQVKMSVLASGTAFTSLNNLTWMSDVTKPPLHISLAGYVENSTITHVAVACARGGNVMRHVVTNNLSTSTGFVALPSSGRYMSLPFEVTYSTALSAVLMTDGQYMAVGVYTNQNLAPWVTSTYTIDGSAVQVPTLEPQQNSYVSNAQMWLGGLFAQVRSRVFFDGPLNDQPALWVANTDGDGQSIDYLIHLPINNSLIQGYNTVVTPDAAMLYNSVNISEVVKVPNQNTYNRGEKYAVHGRPSDATATTFYEIVNTSLADRVYTIYKATYAPTSGGKRNLIPVPNGALLTGANPMLYDGQAARAAGLANAPTFALLAYDNGVSADDGLNPTKVATRENLATPAGGSFTYTYFAVSNTYDTNGRQILGPVSPPMRVTLSGTQNSVAVQTLLGFLPQTQLYRNSIKNPTVYYRVRLSWDSINQRHYDTDFLDTTTQLYAPPSGGELPNDPFPSLAYACGAVDRLYGIPSDAASGVVWSKPYRDGRAVEFNAQNEIDIAPADGPNTALAVMDTALYIFKKRRIYAMPISTGPDATGQGEFGNIALIASDVGCIDPNSVLLTPQGVYFRSERGLQLVSPGAQVQYVGAPVERLLQGQTIIDSTLVSSKNQIRFALSNSTLLVYDHFLARWSTFSGWPVIASTMYQGKYTFTAANRVQVEGTDYRDNLTGSSPTDYSMTIQSPWIPLSAGPQGWGRIRRLAVLGDYAGPHILRASLAYDYDPTWAYTIDCPSDGVAPTQWVVRAPRQVAQSVSLKLTDIPSGSDGKSLAISDITVEVMPKSGMVKNAFSRRL